MARDAALVLDLASPDSRAGWFRHRDSRECFRRHAFGCVADSGCIAVECVRVGMTAEDRVGDTAMMSLLRCLFGFAASFGEPS